MRQRRIADAGKARPIVLTPHTVVHTVGGGSSGGSGGFYSGGVLGAGGRGGAGGELRRQSLSPDVPVTESRFRVMASDAHVVLVDPAADAQGYARRRLEELERRWSRFLPASDVSRLNETPEAFVVVSPDTVELRA